MDDLHIDKILDYLEKTRKEVQFDLQHPKGNEGAKTIEDLPTEVLENIFSYVADTNFNKQPEFRDYLASRSDADYKRRIATPTPYAVMQLISMKRVSKRFRSVIENMGRYKPITVDISLKGHKYHEKQVIMYKYGGSGAQQPASFLNRIWHLEENIQHFEKVRILRVSEMPMTDQLIDAICALDLEYLEEAHFFKLKDNNLNLATKDEQIKKLLDKLGNALKVSFQSDEFDTDRELFGERFLKSYKEENPDFGRERYDEEVMVRRRKYERRDRQDFVGNPMIRVLPKIKKYKMFRAIAINHCLSNTVTKRSRDGLENDHRFLLAKKRVFRDYKKMTKSHFRLPQDSNGHRFAWNYNRYMKNLQSRSKTRKNEAMGNIRTMMIMSDKKMFEEHEKIGYFAQPFEEEMQEKMDTAKKMYKKPFSTVHHMAHKTKNRRSRKSALSKRVDRLADQFGRFGVSRPYVPRPPRHDNEIDFDDDEW